MFEAIVLVEDNSVGEAIEQLALDTGEVSVLRTAFREPSQYEMARLLNTYQPDLVFLEIDNDGAAISRAEAMIANDPGIVIIGFGGPWIRKLAPHLADSGIAAIMPLPLTREGFQNTIEQAVHRVHAWNMETLVSFLPAKAGSGASTVALNVAGAVARLKRRVLLLEADLHSGPISDLIRARPRTTTRDALANSGHLDLTYWRNAVLNYKGVDVMLTDRSKKQPVPTWINCFHLLQFVRTHYDMVIVDLPEIVNDATAEIVRRSRAVHVVTTPDIPPISLARQRMAELEARRVASERMRLVINRWHKSDPALDEIAEELSVPVAAVLRNDFPAVRRATAAGELINPASALGQGYEAFAQALVGIEPPPKKNGLLQMLTGR